MSIFELRGLESLSLGSNKFNNSLDHSVIQSLKNLSYLDLSHINLLTEYNGFNLSLSSVPLLTLILASCKLKRFPDFLRNQSSLSYLDISKNRIDEELPNLIWKLPDLQSLNLSYNYLKTLEGPISNLSIDVPRYLDFPSKANSQFSHLSATWISPWIIFILPYQLSSANPLNPQNSFQFQVINYMGVSLDPYAMLHIFDLLTCLIITSMAQFPNAWLRWVGLLFRCWV
jgi:hypothetical protein